MGVTEFLKFAANDKSMDSNNMIRCPCLKCKNLNWKALDDVKYDLFRYGFLEGYHVWNFHGEEYEHVAEETYHYEHHEQPAGNENIYCAVEMLMDAARLPDMSCFQNSQANGRDQLPHGDASRFFKVLEDATIPLHPTNTKFTRLSFITKLLHFKNMYGCSERGFDELLELIGSILPEDHTLPKSYYEDLALEKNRLPTRLELFERTYKHKRTQNFTSEEARAIAERYKLILDERRQTINEQDEPLEWWIEACGPVKKNRILGEPRISANELLNGSYHENQNPKSPTQSTCGVCLSDDLFFNAVNKTLRTVDSSALFKEASVSREQVQTLAENVVSGDMSNSMNGIAQEIKEELIRLVVTTIEGIYSTIHQSLKESQTNDQATTSSFANDLEDARN
ncbi:unnamed protein product [Rhodiola kirilowii]